MQVPPQSLECGRTDVLMELLEDALGEDVEILGRP